jgi:hypothetical protein
MAVRNVYVAEVETGDVFQPGAAPGTGSNAQYQLDLAGNGIVDGAATTASSLFTALPTNTVTADADDFDWRPAAGSPIAAGGLTSFGTLPAALQAAAQGLVTGTAYRGAADPNAPPWWAGWTYYARD